MNKELKNFTQSYTAIVNSFKKNEYVFFNNQYHPQLDNTHIIEVKDIVDFSLPLIDTRIDLGYRILNQKKQILY